MKQNSQSDHTGIEMGKFGIRLKTRQPHNRTILELKCVTQEAIILSEALTIGPYWN